MTTPTLPATLEGIEAALSGLEQVALATEWKRASFVYA
jgi:hypothetical protein